MDPFIIWSIVLFTFAFALIVADVFVPSGGLLTTVAVLLVILAIILLWQANPLAAMITAFTLAMIVPLLLWQLVKHFDHLPVTRRLMLAASQPALVHGKDADDVADGLVGKRGRTLSDLRPVGACMIEGERIECHAESGVIERGAEVQVVSDSGLEVKVREL